MILTVRGFESAIPQIFNRISMGKVGKKGKVVRGSIDNSYARRRATAKTLWLVRTADANSLLVIAVVGSLRSWIEINK